MRKARLAASAFVVAVLVATPALFGACLGDLDPATTCPPSARRAAEPCTPAFEDMSEPGCFTYLLDAPKYYECLAGPRETCDCLPDECPENDAACFPPGDCPPEVRKVAGPDAKCIRLQSEDFGYGAPQFSECLCGCFACASVCDGFGPVFGLRDPGEVGGSPVFNVPIIDIERYMPSHGTIGYYIRARGISNAQIITYYGDIEGVPMYTGYFMSTPLNDFGDQVLYKEGFVGTGAPYSWTTEADKPKLLALYPPGNGTEEEPQLSLYEIDCVIPFVVPN